MNDKLWPCGNYDETLEFAKALFDETFCVSNPRARSFLQRASEVVYDYAGALAELKMEKATLAASDKKAHLLKGIIMNAIAGGSELNLLEPLTEEEFDALEFKPNPHRHPEFWRLARTAAKGAKSYAHLKKLLSKLPKPDQEG